MPEEEKRVSLGQLRMPYVKVTPIPEGVWRACHPILKAIHTTSQKLPRNVPNYGVQGIPDGCHNCVNLHCGCETQLGCKLACSTPKMPMYCDEVNPLGKCDKWEKFLFPGETPKAGSSDVVTQSSP